MKRITAVLLAALALTALTGCGLEADETIDENGNVQKVDHQEKALEGVDAVVPPADPGAAVGTPVQPPPVTVDTTPTSGNTGVVGGDVNPIINPNDPSVVGLPQDPIPLFDPAKPRPPGGGVDPRTGLPIY